MSHAPPTVAPQPAAALPPRSLRARWLDAIESLGLFVLGLAVMNFIYAASPATPGGRIGVPEHDSFYHVKMAALLPEVGALRSFPWLQFAYFREQGDEFVSHHFGFHVLLAPFVHTAHWLTGDWLIGGRWAMCFVFAVNLVLFNLLLRAGNVPCRWLWLALFFVLPDQFFGRHASVRAIGASLMFMQMILLALFQARYLVAAVVLGLYVHLYLGAVMFGPVVVAAYAAAHVLGPPGDRRFPAVMVLTAAAGWLLGVLTYPYSGGMYEFLKLQVFGTGLTPDIEVGREWKPYTDPWFLVGMASTLLLVWTTALIVRVRSGPRLDARETAVLMLQFGFLLLTLKARRFIEYWPPLCLLSAAYLAGPWMRGVGVWIAEWIERAAPARARAAQAFGLLGLAGVVCALLAAAARAPLASFILADWQVWLAAVALLLLAPLSRIWACGAAVLGTERPPLRLAAILVVAIVFVATVPAILHFGLGTFAAPRVRLHALAWVALAAAYLVVPAVAYFLSAREPAQALRPVVAPSLIVVLAGLALPALVVWRGAKPLTAAADMARCRYDLDAVAGVMDVVQRHSRPGEVIFTDDWDVFPPFFYFNTHNHFIVGLDPKFTHARRPDLWERYVKISRGQVPASLRLVAAKANEETKSLPVELSDIRDEFRASWVITDRDHTRLADLLAQADDLAELVYPAGGYTANRYAPYLLFRIRGKPEQQTIVDARRPAADGSLPLSALRPQQVEQGYGDLARDRSVDGNLMRLHGRLFRSGLGTHATARLTYQVPEHASSFESWVGIDDETEGRGSVVASIWLDGRKVFESPVLRGLEEPLRVRVPLADARTLTLLAECTEDGNRFDHVDWADARFVPDAGPDGPATAVGEDPASRPSGSEVGTSADAEQVAGAEPVDVRP